MARTSTLSSTLNNIIKEVQKLTPLEQAQILVKIRLTNYLKGNKKPVANFDSKKIKPATMEQINKWKHKSRVSL